MPVRSLADINKKAKLIIVKLLLLTQTTLNLKDLLYYNCYKNFKL